MEQDSGDNAGPDQEMPKYKCHKEVWALKIKGIVDPTRAGDETDGSRLLVFEGPNFENRGNRKVSREYVRKHSPKAGGYFVVYEGGYLSFSPAEAFESRYTLIK